MIRDILNEAVYKTSRASGPGGQHVNKTESRVELHWNLEGSKVLDNRQKSTLRTRLGSRLTSEGVLILSSQKYRSQLRNREEVSARFMRLVEKLSRPPKKRIKTRPTRSSVEKRIKEKKALSEKKQRRRGQ